MLWTDTNELKRVLQIDPANNADDARLSFLNEYVSGVLEDILGVRDIWLKTRTEFYKGTGTPNLLLKHRPVYLDTTLQNGVFLNEDAWDNSVTNAFDATTTQLTYGADSQAGSGFCLDLDNQPDLNTSRSGILIRINGVWPKRWTRQAGLLSPFLTNYARIIKVTYNGGWTVDNMPPAFRMAAAMAIARLRILFPFGIIPTSESFEDRSVSVQLLALWDEIRALLWPYMNRKW